MLSKNANKHKEDFVEGMDLVNGVKFDLSSSKQITLETRETFDRMKRNLTNQSAKILLIA